MEVKDTHTYGGSLQISSGVIAKIARMATFEVDGVADISLGANSAGTFMGRFSHSKPINVIVTDGVAEIEVNIIVEYGVQIPSLCQQIQKNIKSSVQNMTSITVARVNVVITGVKLSEKEFSDSEG